MKNVITEISSLSAMGPYSLVVENNGMLFASGQIGITKDKKLVKGGVEIEFKIIMQNIKELLEKAGYKMNEIVKVTLFLSDLKNFQKINELYEQYFEKPFPVRTTVQVAKLPLNANIEVEIVAMR